MGKINKIGVKAICKHCNYSWLYNGSNPVTSCPRDGWRVRIRDKEIIHIKVIHNFNNFFNRIDDMFLSPIEKEKRDIEIRNKRIGYNKKHIELQTKNKFECLSYYSNGDPKCSYPGCNVIDIEILTIDHINGDGWKIKKKGPGLYSYLIKQHFPKGYKVLCFNHNFLEAKQKGFFGRGKQIEKPPIHPT